MATNDVFSIEELVKQAAEYTNKLPPGVKQPGEMPMIESLPRTDIETQTGLIGKTDVAGTMPDYMTQTNQPIQSISQISPMDIQQSQVTPEQKQVVQEGIKREMPRKPQVQPKKERKPSLLAQIGEGMMIAGGIGEEIPKVREQRELKDPTSDISRISQNIAKKLTGKDMSNMSAWTLKQTMPDLFRMAQMEMQKETDVARGFTPYQQYRIGRDIERDIQNYRKTIEGSEKLQSAFNRVDRALQDANLPNLDTIKEDTNLPGYQVLGKRAGGTKARALSQAVYDVLQTMIYDASGKQINAQELERFKKMIGKDPLSNEKLLIRGLKEYKQRMREKMRSIKASYRPEVIKTHEERKKQLPIEAPLNDVEAINNLKQMSNEELKKIIMG